MIHLTPVEFIAQGDRVVVLSEVVFRFRTTGKVAEFAEFFDTARAFAAPNRTPDLGAEG